MLVQNNNKIPAKLVQLNLRTCMWICLWKSGIADSKIKKISYVKPVIYVHQFPSNISYNVQVNYSKCGNVSYNWNHKIYLFFVFFFQVFNKVLKNIRFYLDFTLKSNDNEFGILFQNNWMERSLSNLPLRNSNKQNIGWLTFSFINKHTSKNF